MIELDSSLTSNGFPIADINDIAGGNMYFNTIEERDSLEAKIYELQARLILKRVNQEYPEKIVATYWKDEPAEEWGTEERKVKVNGRKWVKIK